MTNLSLNSVLQMVLHFSVPIHFQPVDGSSHKTTEPGPNIGAKEAPDRAYTWSVFCSLSKIICRKFHNQISTS